MKGSRNGPNKHDVNICVPDVMRISTTLIFIIVCFWGEVSRRLMPVCNRHLSPVYIYIDERFQLNYLK